jgi:hypothetical protein
MPGIGIMGGAIVAKPGGRVRGCMWVMLQARLPGWERACSLPDG